MASNAFQRVPFNCLHCVTWTLSACEPACTAIAGKGFEIPHGTAWLSVPLWFIGFERGYVSLLFHIVSVYL